jgi:hypothetical protein
MMTHQSVSHSRERGFFTLIGLLAVIVIIAIMFVMYTGQRGGTGPAGAGGATTTLGGARDRAGDAVCRNNLSQLRAAVSIHLGTAGANPSSLEELQAGASLSCAAGDEPYEYDPATGKVRCVHPSHEGY